jgi:hypothetical protein
MYANINTARLTKTPKRIIPDTLTKTAVFIVVFISSSQVLEFQPTEFQPTLLQHTEFQPTLSHATGSALDDSIWLTGIPAQFLP